jgi:hypothetical protein
MVASRTLTAVAGLVVGLGVSVLAWVVFDTLVVFLFLPFVPVYLWGAGRSVDRSGVVRKVCPVCDFATRDPDVAYCPRDGRRL